MHEYIKTLLSAVKAWVTGELHASVADWNENNPSSLNYIRNRTHWVEKGLQEGKVIIIDNESINCQEDGQNAPIAINPFEIELNLDETYYVTWDDVEYECVSYRAAAPGTASIGNGPLGDADDRHNNEPFFITAFQGQVLVFGNSEGNHTITISNKGLVEAEIVHKIDPKFLPDNNNNNNVTDEFIVFKDKINGYEYVGEMRNGNFVTYCKTESIQINTFPQKMRYTIGSYINQEGMEVVAIGQNGQNNIIENYECSNVQEDGSVIITYNEAGNCYEVSFQVEIISVEEDLIDFEWYENDDGTYTLTEWKGTYNGEPSTKLIVPDNDLYYIGMEG